MKQIILENRNRIRAIIRKLTGSDNEDIEQEVYIKTWQNMNKYHEEGKFRQWINAVTVNLCRDYFRSRGHRQDAVQIHDEEVLEGISSTARGQEEILDSKARQKMILKAVDDLPAKLRKIVILFEFEEFSYEQIAKKTGLPQGTVKSRLFNARKILSEKLKPLKENTDE